MDFIGNPLGILWMGSAFILVTVQPVPLLLRFSRPLSPRFTDFSCVVLVLVVVST
jgi:hypothetical protein